MKILHMFAIRNDNKLGNSFHPPIVLTLFANTNINCMCRGVPYERTENKSFPYIKQQSIKD